MLIFVNSTLSGKTFSLEVESDDPVHIIKAAIYGHEGIEPKNQYLILAGNKLSDSGTLAENDVHKECTLHLDVRFSGGGRWSEFWYSNIALAKKSNQNKMICRKCYARLHPRAVNCRKKKCGTHQPMPNLSTAVEAKVQVIESVRSEMVN